MQQRLAPILVRVTVAIPVVFVVVGAFWQETVVMTVTRQTWSRSVEIEVRRLARREGRCDEVPPAARSVVESKQASVCTYRIEEWVVEETLAVRGRSPAPPPTWPGVAHIQPCKDLKPGCRRVGERREENHIVFLGPNRVKHDCLLDVDDWTSKVEGSEWSMRRRVVFPRTDCDALRRLSVPAFSRH